MLEAQSRRLDRLENGEILERGSGVSRLFRPYKMLGINQSCFCFRTSVCDENYEFSEGKKKPTLIGAFRRAKVSSLETSQNSINIFVTFHHSKISTLTSSQHLICQLRIISSKQYLEKLYSDMPGSTQISIENATPTSSPHLRSGGVISQTADNEGRASARLQ